MENALDKPSLLEKALKYPVSKTGLRGITAMCAMYFSKDYMGQGIHLVSAFARTAKSALSAQSLHDYTTSVSMIDDFLDTTPGEVILSTGKEAVQGPDFCDFLQMSDLNPDIYMKALNNLIDLGMIDKMPAVAFSNIFAMLALRRAQQEIEVRSTQAPEGRMQLFETNKLLSQVYAVFVFRCMNRQKTLPTDSVYLTPQEALQPFPEITKLAGLMQVVDDIRDLLIDLEAEIKTGVISPNAIAAFMPLKASLSSVSEANDDVRRFIEQRSTFCDAIPIYESPDVIRHAFNGMHQQFMAGCAQISNTLSRSILCAMYRNTLAEGLKSSAHPSHQGKVQKRHSEIAAVKAKYAVARV